MLLPQGENGTQDPTKKPLHLSGNEQLLVWPLVSILLPSI